ncbi:hypothetical protein K1719_015886 [Acacia pycnantha]|nr:hypothetical protein K1719_015886 [Acacia pycnantha]
MADNGFKSGFANALQSMMEEKLPGCGIKACPHITSRIKTLKKLWQTAYDMVYGPNTSGFGWDPDTKCVTADKDVWDGYIKYDSLAPKRPSKSNRSEPNLDASLDHSTVVSHNIPELLKFQSFQSQPHAMILDEPPKDAANEFVETQYYKELSSIDRQHHTTGSEFIRIPNTNEHKVFVSTKPNQSDSS